MMETAGANLEKMLSDFKFEGRGKRTQKQAVDIGTQHIPAYINEFWTAKQRQASSIHEISYRACFKPQLPRFFIERLTGPGDVVYDPFGGRGTTAVEAGLLGRKAISNDVNPLSETLTRPRLEVPSLKDIAARLDEVKFDACAKADRDLSMFYHPATLAEMVSLREYLCERKAKDLEDALDRWIRMVATNRLTGHSPGFFSVYTLPPNQATSPKSQVKINKAREQEPEYRDVKKLILRKSKSLLRTLTGTEGRNLRESAKTAMFLTEDSRHTSAIKSNSVRLTVTSPPFLDIVQYSQDNWLRCWFNGIDDGVVSKRMTMSRTIDDWAQVMGQTFKELYRITRPGGWVAFEVGEVRKGKIRLEESVVPIGMNAGFGCEAIVINSQKFTKTSNIWGVDNNECGTNTNRIVLMRKR